MKVRELLRESESPLETLALALRWGYVVGAIAFQGETHVTSYDELDVNAAAHSLTSATIERIGRGNARYILGDRGDTGKLEADTPTRAQGEWQARSEAAVKRALLEFQQSALDRHDSVKACLESNEEMPSEFYALVKQFRYVDGSDEITETLSDVNHMFGWDDKA